jgi:hypothetical protein
MTDLSDPYNRRMCEKFEEFHRENPRVYRMLVHLARQWTASGRDVVGIARLYERLRWDIALATTGDDFKVSNDWRSFYARLIMWREPDLRDLFRLRPSVADAWIEEYKHRGTV